MTASCSLGPTFSLLGEARACDWKVQAVRKVSQGESKSSERDHKLMWHGLARRVNKGGTAGNNVPMIRIRLPSSVCSYNRIVHPCVGESSGATLAKRVSGNGARIQSDSGKGWTHEVDEVSGSERDSVGEDEE